MARHYASPLAFDYDADMTGDPPAYVTCSAKILTADGSTVADMFSDECEVGWQALQEIARNANRGERLAAASSRLGLLIESVEGDIDHQSDREREQAYDEKLKHGYAADRLEDVLAGLREVAAALEAPDAR